jgi:hypothetical protein
VKPILLLEEGSTEKFRDRVPFLEEPPPFRLAPIKWAVYGNILSISTPKIFINCSLVKVLLVNSKTTYSKSAVDVSAKICYISAISRGFCNIEAALLFFH